MIFDFEATQAQCSIVFFLTGHKKFHRRLIFCLSLLSHPLYYCWVMLRTTAREAEPAEMVEGMAGSKSQQRQINDRIPLSALGTVQPDLLEEERGPHTRTHLQGCLYKTDSVSAALRVRYYKHMLHFPCVTDSSACPWMTPTQNIPYVIQYNVDRNSLPWSILPIIFF